QLQFNQLYLTDEGFYDAAAMFKHQNKATVVNGIQFAYTPNMLHNILVNGDENRNVFVPAQPWNGLEHEHMQSQLLYVELDQHVRIFVENQGNEPVFVAGDPFGLNPRLMEAGIIEAPVPSYAHVLGNPSSAVPPMGMNSIAHPAVNIHGLYTDEIVAEKKAAGNVALWEVIPTLPPVP
ncbi:MAG: copper oxidase, partial [Nitrosopumilus sp.]|nr:copper oxidase [Nitrosopumilus sp.]